jgi:nickel transport protein
MTKIHKGLAVSVLCFFLAGLSGPLWAQNPPDENAGEVIVLLKEQNRQLSGDLRRIQREIAALRADLDKPGVKDVFAGIGYIVGLFGAAAFAASRRRE